MSAPKKETDRPLQWKRPERKITKFSLTPIEENVKVDRSFLEEFKPTDESKKD